jgi:hypothetical protein
MLSFGENGWIQYGWSKHLNREKKYKDDFYIKFAPAPEKLSNDSPLKIAIRCIEKIAKTYPPPYHLMCSGGTDSQAVCYAWLKSGIPFNIASVKYVSNDIYWNQHDLITLEKFADINKLNIDFKEFDVIHFLENDLKEIVVKYECPSPQISTHIKMTDLVPSGTIIFSGNFIDKRGLTCLTPALLGIHKFSLYKDRTDISIIPFFFLEYPELAYAFLDNEPPNKDNRYLKHGFPIIQQPSNFTGFEELKNFYDKYRERITPFDRLKFSNKPSNRVFDLLFRYPYEDYRNHRTFQGIT